MSYPPGPYEGSPEWQGQQPAWQGQPPAWQGQQPGWQTPQPGWQGQREPENYLVWAILCTVLCCLPIGIVSIVYSTKVSGLVVPGAVCRGPGSGRQRQEVGHHRRHRRRGLRSDHGAVLFVAIAVAVSHLPSTTTTTYSGF